MLFFVSHPSLISAMYVNTVFSHKVIILFLHISCLDEDLSDASLISKNVFEQSSM